MGIDYPGTGTGKRPAAGGGASTGRPLGDLGRRVAVALPAAAVTVAVVLEGGLLLAVAAAVVGCVAAWELYRLLGVARRARVAGMAAVLLLPPAALHGGTSAMLLVLMAAMPAAFAFCGGSRDDASRSIAATMLVVVWIGVALAHGVLLRELPGGGLLVIGVLIGTFIGDTAAHLVGAAIGRVQIAPRLSPSKTLEGLLAGIVGGTLALLAFMTLADAPLHGLAAAFLGLTVAVAAPVGDLFESLFKRDAGEKDSGRALGAHGGVLDRVDAVLFTLVVGYYVARLLL